MQTVLVEYVIDRCPQTQDPLSTIMYVRKELCLLHEVFWTTSATGDLGKWVKLLTSVVGCV